MSTKIYTAWRVELRRLNEFIDQAHRQMFRAARAHVSKIIAGRVTRDGLGAEPPWIQELPERRRPAAVRRWMRGKAFEMAMERCKKAAQDPLGDPWDDICCGLNIWIRGRYAYIIPIGHNWAVGAITKPPWVESYCYWNNTDEPRGISVAEWKRRGRTWAKINCGTGTADHNARRLYHAVIDLRTIGGEHELRWEMVAKHLHKRRRRG